MTRALYRCASRAAAGGHPAPRGQGGFAVRSDVRKYTPRAQLKPLGAPEPASGARETGGGGRPARLCQKETLVLAEQFSSMEHDAFRVPYLSDLRPAGQHHVFRQALPDLGVDGR